MIKRELSRGVLGHKNLLGEGSMQVWFSGIIAACHAVDPGSIPGICTFSSFS